VAEAADWPCYLGANRDNTSNEKNLKLWTGDSPKVLWKAGSETAGYASAVVFPSNSDKLVTRFNEMARAKILDGRCWTVPIVANGSAYCRNHAGELVCLDLR